MPCGRTKLYDGPRLSAKTVTHGCALLVALVIACAPPPPAPEPLPGAAEHPAALTARLQAARARRGPGDQARTRHRRPDGSPRFTNRLLLETSPYLLQHAHNPVDWYPWGDEAFARALADGKPVLLSVGYSTCHWCHVMEEESFEDEEVAAFLNRHYVAIKVDREERPDLDAAYMTAVQLVSGRGGWPMTVWLTPTRQPFYGGTYFPPRDGGRGMRVGFLTLLERLQVTFADSPLQVTEQAHAVASRVRDLMAPPPGDALPDASLLHAAFTAADQRFDDTHGGFGSAPKFPLPAGLDLLLRYHRRTGNARALAMVTRTLERMAAGGIHDQLGGGFHRYATDATWLVPHFEKMLYDNAQLATVYLAAGLATGRSDFTRVARDILDYVGREMTAPGGGFYAATDADSEGAEGTFFLWTPAEIAAALDPETARAAGAYWGVTDAGTFAGRNILHVPRPLADVAATLQLDPPQLEAVLADARARLYAVRQTRVPPHTDTKVLTAWNGLMIGAFARAGAALDEPTYVARAHDAASFVLEHMRPGGRLQRSWAGGRAHQDAFLEDHAFLASGLLDLYEATAELRWLRAALALHQGLARDFWDDAGGGFFATAARAEAPLGREKPADDGVLPSGNAVAAETLLRLAHLTGDDAHRARAEVVLRVLAPAARQAPANAARLLAALDFATDRAKEIVIVTPAADAGDGAALVAAARAAYVPNRVLTVASEGRALAAQAELVPLVRDKRALGGRATAYVCEERVCALPTSDPAVLRAQLATVHPLGP